MRKSMQRANGDTDCVNQDIGRPHLIRALHWARWLVPILCQNGLHGTISLVWMSDNISLDHVLELGGLDDLRKASARIGVALECEGIVAPLSERHPPSGAND